MLIFKDKELKNRMTAIGPITSATLDRLDKDVANVAFIEAANLDNDAAFITTSTITPSANGIITIHVSNDLLLGTGFSILHKDAVIASGLVHEWVHVEQYGTGRLFVPEKGLYIWKGKPHLFLEPCLEQAFLNPWEKEAHLAQLDFMRAHLPSTRSTRAMMRAVEENIRQALGVEAERKAARLKRLLNRALKQQTS